MALIKFKIDEAKVCSRGVRVYVCVYPSQAIFSETIEDVSNNLGMVTASDMVLHHLLIILVLIVKNNKRSIISKTVQAMPIKFAVNIV